MNKKNLTINAQEKLLKYNFPGNVRELKSIIELALILSDGSEIEADDIRLPQTSTPEKMLKEESTLKDYNNKIVKHFLDKYDYDVMLVAEKLNIGKSTIYRMLQNQEI